MEKGSWKPVCTSFYEVIPRVTIFDIYNDTKELRRYRNHLKNHTEKIYLDCRYCEWQKIQTEFLGQDPVKDYLGFV
jgi:hypothetical protein